ncbi:unnamed protein product, partial [Amoebophrya sp. A25]|eukprot:GSA25T00027555001.1
MLLDRPVPSTSEYPANKSIRPSLGSSDDRSGKNVAPSDEPPIIHVQELDAEEVATAEDTSKDVVAVQAHSESPKSVKAVAPESGPERGNPLSRPPAAKTVSTGDTPLGVVPTKSEGAT